LPGRSHALRRGRALQEALSLWRGISALPAFREKPMILVFTHADVLAEKVRCAAAHVR
jgi:hypothetical protein